MSAANDLIERMERETGQRVDDNDGYNMAIAGLLGAMSRLLGKSPSSYKAEDDVAAGVLIRAQMTPEHKRKQESDRVFADFLADMLAAGMSPDDIKGLLG